MAQTRKWARVLEETLVSSIQAHIHAATASVVLRELCETPRRLLPVHSQWLSGPNANLAQRIANYARQPEYIASKARLLALLLGSNITNTMWTAHVLLSIAVYEFIPTLVSR